MSGTRSGRSARIDFSRRDAQLRERMDDDAADAAMLDRTYAQFRVINAAVAGWRRIYRRRLRPLLQTGEAATLLDIGSGGGDVVRALARWAVRDGLNLQITAIDPDERAHAFASAQPKMPNLTFRQAYSSELVREGLCFDLVTSNHMLHHLNSAELSGLLRDTEQLCKVRAVHVDIARTRAGYTLFSAATWPFFRRSFIREDGLLSIRRSYTPDELAAVVPARWRVEYQRPYRNLLLYEAPAEAEVRQQ